MSKYIIEGGSTLSGTITPSGNKNEALPCVMACLLTDQIVTLQNIPKIGDVVTSCEILQKMGVEVEWTKINEVTMNAAKLHKHEPDPALCSKIRASILMMGPLLARMGKVVLALPGGDVIGARRIDSHWEGAQTLGAKLEISGAAIQAEMKNLKAGDVFLDEPSVTATENLVMLACLGHGRTVLHNAACEPHVVGLCNMLNGMGAKISGIGSNRIVIDAVAKLGGVKHRISPDFMEVGSFLCLGAVAGGEIRIESGPVDNYRFILKVMDKLGIEVGIEDNFFTVKKADRIRMKTDLSGRVATIYSGPWPAFPTDLMSVAIVAATQGAGTVIFFEKMFEGRMFFTDKLMAMGATIILCDPHRIVVNGPAQLFGAQLSSPDVRAGMALVIASLVAKGKSEISNTYQIERGYFDIVSKLQSLGAKIKRVD